MTAKHRNEAGQGRVAVPSGPDPLEPIFRRAKENPIVSARDLPFKAAAVLNPGAAEHNGEVVLLLRVEDVEGFSNIHVARSQDGVNAWRPPLAS